MNILVNMCLFLEDKPESKPNLTWLTSLAVNEGQNVTLHCFLRDLGNPHIIWSWICGYKNLSLQANNFATQSTLTFRANREYNQKTCQCLATSPRSSLIYNESSEIETITVYCKLCL